METLSANSVEDKKTDKIGRRDFIKLTGLVAGGLALPKTPDLKPDWPSFNKEALPEKISSLLEAVPFTSLGQDGYLHFKNETGRAENVPTTQTQFNIENSRNVDRLRTDAPWAIVLHWTGGTFKTPKEFVDLAFNPMRRIGGMGELTGTSAHFLVGKAELKTGQTIEDPLSIAQIQKPDTDGVPFRAAHLAAIDWDTYHQNGRRWYPVNAMYHFGYYFYPGFHSTLQDIYDGIHISPDKRSLGIEIAGKFFDEEGTRPTEQETANVISTAWALMKAYNIGPWNVIGHYEIEPGKGDPGKVYLAEVRFYLGLKALTEEGDDSKQLVFGMFLEGSNSQEASKNYFESVRNYLVLTATPLEVASFEERTRYWDIMDSLFPPEQKVPVATSFRRPISGTDIGTGFSFLQTRDDGGYHTGKDYNTVDDAGKPVFLIGDSVCIYSGFLGTGFGNTAIFRFRTKDGAEYITRYLHLENLPNTKEGEIYKKGFVVGNVGRSGGWPVNTEHLHLDIAPVATYQKGAGLELKLNYWPKPGTKEWVVKSSYIDPEVFLGQ